MNFDWYSKLHSTDEIEQGDLIVDCPILIPPPIIEIGIDIEVTVTYIDSIILSQTCDLINNKLQIVLVSPFFSLKTFVESLPEDQRNKKGIKRNIENLRKGHLPGYHLLNKNLAIDIKDYLVVDFRNVYGINITALKSIAKKKEFRVRLLPPYREHLSQAFARFFMRVGLPQDIKIEGY